MTVSGFILILCLVCFLLGAFGVIRIPKTEWGFLVPREPGTEDPHFEQLFSYSPKTGIAHAPTIMETPAGFSVAWFQGSREAQPDIEICKTDIVRMPTGWSVGEVSTLQTSADLSAHSEPWQLVVTMGNIVQDTQRPDSLFVTIVSLGGWAMASVAHILHRGGTKVVRKLNLSPILNRSQLVRSPMIPMTGHSALPAYFEMGRAHSYLVRLDDAGRVVDRARIWGKALNPIQPMIVPTSETRAIAFMRLFAQREVLAISKTQDGGKTWSEVRRSNIPNPGAPVAAIGLGGDRILAAMNCDQDAPKDLILVLSEDAGDNWRELSRFSDAAGAIRYPMMTRLCCGSIALVFSFADKHGIRTLVFNDAWVQAQ